MGYRTEPDGTRVYDKGYRYKPKTDRVQVKLQPGQVRFHGIAYDPLPLLPDQQRTRPWTRPDSEAIEHDLGCRCRMCMTVPRVRKKKRERLLKRESRSR